jgi:hypothetical protein
MIMTHDQNVLSRWLCALLFVLLVSCRNDVDVSINTDPRILRNTWTGTITSVSQLANLDAFAWSPDGKSFVTAKAAVLVWQVSDQKQLFELKKPVGSTTVQVIWSKVKNQIGLVQYLQDRSYQILIYDGANGQLLSTLQPSSGLNQIKLSPNLEFYLGFSTVFQEVYLNNLKNNENVRVFGSGSSSVESFFFGPSGNELGIVLGSSSLMYDIQSKQIAEFTGVWIRSFSSDGSEIWVQVFSSNVDAPIKVVRFLWRARKLIGQWDLPKEVDAFDLDPNSKRYVYSDSQSQVMLNELDSNRSLKLTGQLLFTQYTAASWFSPDGTQVVTKLVSPEANGPIGPVFYSIAGGVTGAPITLDRNDKRNLKLVFAASFVNENSYSVSGRLEAEGWPVVNLDGQVTLPPCGPRGIFTAVYCERLRASSVDYQERHQASLSFSQASTLELLPSVFDIAQPYSGGSTSKIEMTGLLQTTAGQRYRLIASP